MVRFLTFVFVLWLPLLSGQAIISTVAGGDNQHSALGMPPLSVDIGVRAVVAAPDGSIFILDTDHHLVYRISSGGTLKPFAGNELSAYSGDGGTATSASLSYPSAIALDASGALYIADTFNHRVRKVSVEGAITTVAGGRSGYSGDGGPATRAGLVSPTGIAVDAAGALYIADSGSHRIRKVSPDGTISTFAGDGSDSDSGDDGPATSAGLRSPAGLAIDAANDLYFTDSDTYRVRKVTPAGVISAVAGNGDFIYSGDGGPATSAGIDASGAIAVDAAGALYIADTANGRIRKVSPDGTIRTVAGDGNSTYAGDGRQAVSVSLNFPEGVALGANGAIYIADTGSNYVRTVGPDGAITTIAGNGSNSYSGDGQLAISARLAYPDAVSIDATGVLYIADNANHRIRKVGRDGIITTVAGDGRDAFSGDNGAAVTASLANPHGVAVDALGALYIADTANNRIRKVSQNGIITTVAGDGRSAYAGDGGPATSASLRNPYRVVIDATGTLYIADAGNQRIRKVSRDGTISTIAGNGIASYSGDGGQATNAGLSNPLGVAVDAAGIVYIADTGNNRIRKVDFDGNITTVAGNGSANGGYSDDSGLATSASLTSPYDVAVDMTGALYIADPSKKLLRKITSAGIIMTVAGNGSSLDTGDGGPAMSAGLGNPVGVAVDAAGAIYVADNLNNRIRKVSPQGVFTLSVAPPLVSLNATAGGAPAIGATLNIAASGATVGFNASADASWLTLSTSFGSTPTALQIQVDPSSLTAGAYSAMITITAPALNVDDILISVTLTVDSALPPQLNVSVEPVRFSAVQGGSPLLKSIPIGSTGGGALSITAKADQSWLSIRTTAGRVTPSQPATLQVTVNPGALAPGSYVGNIRVNDANIPVLLAITKAAHKLLVSQTGLKFTTVSSGGTPLPQTFGILNVGQDSLDWHAQSTASWLKLSVDSGSVQRPSLDVSLVDVSVDASALSAGEYYGQIRIRDVLANNSPQLVTVVLNVLPAGSSLPPEVRPNGLIFFGQQGEAPGSQEMLVSSPSSSNFVVKGQSGAGATDWLKYLPNNGAVMPNQQSRIRVQTDFSTLLPGAYRGRINLYFPDLGVNLPLNILTVVGSQDTTSCTPLQPIHTGALQDLVAPPGQSASIEVSAVDSCGTALASDTGYVSATIPATKERLSFVSIGQGRWQTNWTPPFSVSDSTQVDVTAFNLDSSKSSAVLHLTFTHPQAGSGPSITPLGVTSSAYGGVSTRVAPGSLVSIYGSRLAETVSQASATPLGSKLGGVQVQLGDTLLPLLYTSGGQVNAQIPFEVPVDTELPLVIQNGQKFSPPITLSIAATQPGLFTGSSGQIIAVNASRSGTTVSADEPAQAGDVLIFYGTGFGAVQGVAPTGDVAPGLARTSTPVSVTIGGQSADVAYAGLTPGLIGLYQLNVTVPAGAQVGPSAPVVVTQGRVSTQAAIALK